MERGIIYIIRGSLFVVRFFTGEISWELDLGSPIVGMYEWKPDGLQKIPFTVVAEQTIDSIIRSAVAGENDSRFVGKGKELVLKYVILFYLTYLSSYFFSNLFGVHSKLKTFIYAYFNCFRIMIPILTRYKRI